MSASSQDLKENASIYFVKNLDLSFTLFRQFTPANFLIFT